MRTYLLLTILCFSSFHLNSQKLALEKASPFTAVRWENEEPIVQFEGNWYQFEKLDHFTKIKLLDFCKEQFGDKWKRRFSEDLVEVLNELGYQPNVNVRLQLSQNGVLTHVEGLFSYLNRQKSYQYNKAVKAKLTSENVRQNIPVTEALEDIRQFEELLGSTSSYAQVSTYDYIFSLKQLANVISKETSDVSTQRLTNELGKILSEIGDRHSFVRNESIDQKKKDAYHLKLPFGVTTVAGQFVAVKQHVKNPHYSYYYTTHPFLKSIDGIAIEVLVDSYNHRDKKAPYQAKITRGANAVQYYGALLFKNNIRCPDSVTVVFANGVSDRTEVFKLSAANYNYVSKLTDKNNTDKRKMEDRSFEGLATMLADSIGYISIPQMYSYTKSGEIKDFITNTFKQFATTKAVVIDIRNNPGGTRDILQTFAAYIVQPEQTPWIANVAYLRTDKQLFGDENSMGSRYLYSYNSKQLSDKDRSAIDTFNINYNPQKTVTSSKFSSPFYMVLHSGKDVYTKPIYILVNENSFSAATVFTSAFKGLPNVKIVGETTDGSSGNSIKMNLKNSNISIKLSTMLSFQRNGKTLDGNGTLPDIHIPADEKQILEGVDSQLLTLVKRINTR